MYLLTEILEGSLEVDTHYNFRITKYLPFVGG